MINYVKFQNFFESSVSDERAGRIVRYVRLKDINLQENINNRVFIQFLARDVSVRNQKDGVKKYINLNMVDGDIVVEARIFDVNDNLIDSIVSGKVYNAAVDVKPYDKSSTGYSCIIYNIEEANVPPEYFAKWAEGLNECKEELEDILHEIIETIYGKIAYKILISKWNKFASWTAAKNQHHTELGGLMVHTVAVAKMADILADYFNDKYGPDFINKPLLLSAAIIHDIGKVEELCVDTRSGSVKYSDTACLSSHIMNTLADIERVAYQLGIGVQQYTINEIDEEEPIKSDEQLNIEREAVLLLKHCVAAHHGQREWGSPVVPATPEAYLLHKLDEIDAEMYKYNRSFKNLENGHSLSEWVNNDIKSVYKEISK